MIWQQILIPVQEGQGFRSLQDIIKPWGCSIDVSKRMGNNLYCSGMEHLASNKSESI
jgi:hypothetical protein